MENRKRHFVAVGFTLLELLVAMALMNVIALSLFSSMRTATKAKRSATAVVKPYRYIVPAFDFLREDLSCALKPGGVFAGSFLAENNVGQKSYHYDTMSFYTTSYQPEDVGLASNIIQVQYLLEDDTESGLAVLKRRKTINLLPTGTAETVDEIVCRNVLSFDIQMYNGTSWDESWDSTTLEDALPNGVRVTIILYFDDKYSESRAREERDWEEDYNEKIFTNIFLPTCASDSLGSG